MFRYAFLLALLPGFFAQASYTCNVDLHFGLVVNDKQIRVLDESRTVYQINGQEQLIVQGEWVELNEQQSAELKKLSKGLHYAVPKMTLLASEGVKLATDTVEHMYLGLVGEEHKSYEKIQRALERVREKVKKKFIHANDNYFIGPRSLENVDDLVDQQLEEEIELAIHTSIGGILSAISGLATDGSEDIEQRMENLSERLENMGQEIERQVGPQADSLRKKARWFCRKLEYLNKVEDSLRQQVPQLKPYDVIITEKSS